MLKKNKKKKKKNKKKKHAITFNLIFYFKFYPFHRRRKINEIMRVGKTQKWQLTQIIMSKTQSYL